MAQHNFAIYLNECLPEQARVKPATSTEIYTLISCPGVPFGTRYKFVVIDNGRRSTIAIGRARSKHASLNLANIRRRGARLGAAEVHIIR